MHPCLYDQIGARSSIKIGGRNVVAFDAANTCSAESRAVIAAAADVLKDLIAQDLSDLESSNEPLNSGSYLPPAWQIGLDKEFMSGMASAMESVNNGLAAGWEGPVNTAEELCLSAVLGQGADAIPEIFNVENQDRLNEDITYFIEVAFQDLDHEFLFEPEMDGIEKSDVCAQVGMHSLSKRDAFKRFSNR